MKTLAGLDYDERGAGEVVCLVHAGAFKRMVRTVVRRARVGRLPRDPPHPAGLRRQPGAVGAGQPGRASPALW